MFHYNNFQIFSKNTLKLKHKNSLISWTQATENHHLWTSTVINNNLKHINNNLKQPLQPNRHANNPAYPFPRWCPRRAYRTWRVVSATWDTTDIVGSHEISFTFTASVIFFVKRVSCFSKPGRCIDDTHKNNLHQPF